jgi:hypothetical protein
MGRVWGHVDAGDTACAKVRSKCECGRQGKRGPSVTYQVFLHYTLYKYGLVSFQLSALCTYLEPNHNHQHLCGINCKDPAPTIPGVPNAALLSPQCAGFMSGENACSKKKLECEAARPCARESGSSSSHSTSKTGHVPRRSSQLY